ncbi:MAG: hypothetical protein OIF47_03695 [Marinibacterium sp.]|nr:hypothetical protein [Marinibacterium sp.]
MTLKLALIGNSNSIAVKGFPWPFNAHPEVEFTNCSMGGSGSPVAAWAEARLDLSQFDVVMFDLWTNEEVRVAAKRSNMALIRDHTLSLVNAISQAGAIPVAVSFPHLHFLRKDSTPVHRLAMRLVRELGLAHLDLYGVIRRCIRFTPFDIPLDQLFWDDPHIQRCMARAVGFEIIPALQALPAPRRTDITLGAPYAPGSYLPVGTLCPDAALTPRSTRLLSADVLPITSARQIHLQGSRKITGVHLNEVQTTRNILINGRVLADLPSRPDLMAMREKQSFVSTFRPAYVSCPEGRVMLSLGDTALPDTAPVAELAGLSMTGARDLTHVTVNQVPDAHRNLAAHFTRRFHQHLALMAMGD